MRAVIVGRLGRDAELRHTPGGDPVLGFSVAEDIGTKDNPKTHWVNCSVWGKRAESRLGEFLKKGQQVVVFGTVTLREYTGRDSTTKTALQCSVEDIKLVGSKRDAGDAAGPKAEPSDPGPAASEPGEVSFDDDDIPF